MNQPITDALLHAYADGQLNPAQRQQVEAYLAQNPVKADEVALWRRQNQTINALFPVTAEPVPERLRPQRLAQRLPRRRSEFVRFAAAAMIMLTIGGTAGWVGNDYLNPPAAPYERLIESAVFAHALYVGETRHAVEVAATDKDHMLTWLSARIDRPLSAPNLDGQGFALVGGRLLPPDAAAASGPAAQLMYENANGQRVTVYVTAALDTKGPEFELANQNGLEAFYWANQSITCTVVGDLPKAQMDVVAKDVYQQMTWRPDSFLRSYFGIFGAFSGQKT